MGAVTNPAEGLELHGQIGLDLPISAELSQG